ncbi:MAG: cation:proton antiporter [Bryobacteraceae bacterium]|nr:cation:proton antiporter [Bryobacteraceae bacterium]
MPHLSVLGFFAGGEEALKLPLAMLIVFGMAKLFGELAERAHLPSIAGEIVAGLVIGPGVLNWVQPDGFIHSLADLGVMFLLFRVGLEVRASELVRVGGVATLAALAGVVVPFVAGYALLSQFGAPTIEATFVGAAMVATSVGITAKVLAERGLLNHRASRIILVAAVIDDVLGLLVLAVVSSMAKGSVNFLQLSLTAVLAIGFVMIVVFWGVDTATRFLPWVKQRLRIAEADFVLAIVILFGLAVVSVYAGVAAIVGAFLAGMMLGESASHRVHELTSGAAELLVPFFLVNIGLQLDPRTFADPATLWISLAVFFAAVVSKLVGCGLGSWQLGRRDAIRVGAGMVPRGEVGMVVAQIGLSFGVVPQNIYAATVFMSVMTTIVAPPLLKWAYRGEGRRETLEPATSHN